MSEKLNRVQLVQCWIAIFMTAGEFTLGFVVWMTHGDMVVLYVAIAAFVRETHGGHHYHEVIGRAVLRVYHRDQRLVSLE